MFSPITNKKVYQYVVEQIQHQIYSGQLQTGDKLPSERDLTEQLNVSRASVREALRALEITGLIETRQGEGNFINGSFENALLQPMKAMFMLNKGKPKDLLDFRSNLEMLASELAASSITDDQCLQLRAILDELREAREESHKAELDMKLHYFIAEITDNILVINILSIISSMLEEFIQTSRLKILENPDNRAILMKNHEDVVESIISKNPEKAKMAMKSHMDMIRDIVNI